MPGLSLGVSLIGPAAWGRRAFSPLDLNPLMFVDPLDTSTLFKETGGLTTAASIGDPLGTVLHAGMARTADLFDLATPGGSFVQSGRRFTGAALGAYSPVVQLNATGQPWYSGHDVFWEVDIEVHSITGQIRAIDGATSGWSVSAPGRYLKTYRGINNNLNIQTGGGGPHDVDVTVHSIRALPAAHLAASSSAARPTLQAGGLIRTDGVDDFLSGRVSVGAARSIYVAGRVLSDGAFIVGADFTQSLRYDHGSDRLDSEPGFWKPFASNTLALNEWFVAAFRMDGATKYMDQLTTVNGMQSATAAYVSSPAADKIVSLGARHSNAEHTSAEYGAMCVFDGFISGSEHDKVMDFLAARVGISA